MNGNQHYDIVVLGSGFAGSLLATVLATRGRSVAVLDRDRHPRFTIGESSTPAADFLLEEISSEYALHEIAPLTRYSSWRARYPDVACGCKRGFSYLWHGGPRGFEATPDHENELLVAASRSEATADTQWYRPDVDTLFAQVARDRGVRVIESCSIESIEHVGPSDWKVNATLDDQPLTVNAKFIVDASGPSQLLLRFLGIEDDTSKLRTNSSAVFGHWHDLPQVTRWLASNRVSMEHYPYRIDDSAVHQVFEDGWLWQLRFDNNTTSVGFVFAGGVQASRRAATPRALWDSLLHKHAVLRDLVGESTLASFPGQLFASSRLQRLARRGAGADWAALPFTIGFIDPLHSTGIAHSLSGVKRLCGILLGDDASRHTALARYSDQVTSELVHIDRLVAGCYASLHHFSLFKTWTMTYFAAATLFEKHWKAGEAERFGLLGANDASFVATIESLLPEIPTPEKLQQEGESAVHRFGDWVQQKLEPFNTVGLFCPQYPNLYHQTAADN